MSLQRIIRIAAVWPLFIPVAIGNGLLREAAITPAVGPEAGHVISTVLLALLIWLVAYLMLRRRILDYGRTEILVAGILWAFLTVSFEFLFGRYVAGKPWEVLVYDYNIMAGRIWVLVLVVLVGTPMTVRSLVLKSARRER